ncbi:MULTISPECIES: rod-binding protein [unclassified Borrelia]|uniref:rod-binding protein n=1 Tax=unclassified Borrelia TaxID=2649934 RepID=UPI001E401236|nr:MULTISPECIES: rod-binding protein [unclassified Borrelia]UGQ16421.1 rod-binding protein [Borrelia sp. RT5S]UGQ17546.1 rod-binding protein [Borrelia sp. RT1S]
MNSGIDLQYLETKSQINQIKNLEKKAKQVVDKHNRELYDASLEFEAVFINQMLKSMRSSLKKENNLINGGQTEEIFEDMLYLERAKQIAKFKNFGLADLIYNQIAETDNSSR